MRRLIIALAGLALLGLFIPSCKKEDDPEKVELNAPVISAKMDGEAVKVTWKPVTNALSYIVESKKAADSDFTVVATVTHSPATINGLEFGNTYEFRAKAICGEVQSPYSNVVSLEVAKYLSKPVVTVNAGISFIDVDWEPVEGAASYQLEHKLSLDSDYTVDYTGDGSDIERHFRISGLEGGLSYDVRVGAVAEGFSMGYSDVNTIATTEGPSSLIATADQLIAWLADIDETNGDVAALACDIDMSGKTITSASGFSGTLEGQGFAIKNLTSSVPLFAENSGRIKNLVLDESCVFTPASSEFGALVALDKGGSYTSVSSAASITYTAAANITENLAIGGLVGAANSKDIATVFTSCSHSGPITIAAAGYTHHALAIGGIIGYTRQSKFESCTNSGPISLTALYGDPFHQWSYVGSSETADVDGNMCIGGIVGKAWDVTDEYESTLNNCENLSGGDITVTHTAINKLATSDVNDQGCLHVGGIVGQGNGTEKKCHNRAPITVSAISDNNSHPERRNCVLHVGGILGCSYRGNTQESCSNRAAITVAYDGSWEGQPREMSAVGGVVGKQGYNKTTAKSYFCTNHGPITVTGKGTLNVGGIAGSMGYQRGNKVYAEAPMDVYVRKAYVGGLLGFADGNSAYQHIKSSWCKADITARSTETSRYNLATGGLVGYYAFGQSGSYPSLVWVDDEGPCHYKGNISTPGQFKTGVAIGWINIKDKIHVYGSQEHPIELSGTIEREELEKATVSSSNVFSGHYQSDSGYGFTDGNLAIGSIKTNTDVTIWCTCAE